MRMPRSLGVVATAFLALGLGLGMGAAAVSNYFGSAGASRAASNTIGTSRRDASRAEPTRKNADHALSERGTGGGKAHSKRPTPNANATSKSPGRDADAGGSSGVARHASDPWTGQSWKAPVQARLTTVFTAVRPNAARGAPPPTPSATGGEAVSHEETVPDQNGTDADALSIEVTALVHLDTRISNQATRAEPVESRADDARTTVWSNGNSTHRHHDEGAEARGARDTNVSHDGARAGDDAATTHSSCHRMTGTGHRTGEWEEPHPHPDD